MSDVVTKISLALAAFKARQQDIAGLSQRAFKDLFAAANAAMLTSDVQNLIEQSYAEMITASSAKTSLLAAVSQHHTEIIAGCRVLSEDDGTLRALIDAANAATIEAFRMIYPAPPKASPLRSRATKTNAQQERPPKKTARQSSPAREVTRPEHTDVSPTETR
jgi:hypothetical protein